MHISQVFYCVLVTLKSPQSPFTRPGWYALSRATTTGYKFDIRTNGAFLFFRPPCKHYPYTRFFLWLSYTGMKQLLFIFCTLCVSLECCIYSVYPAATKQSI